MKTKKPRQTLPELDQPQLFIDDERRAIPPSGPVDVLIAAASAGLGPQDVAQLTTYWAEEVGDVLTPYVAEVYTGSAAYVALGLADGFPNADLPGVPLVADEYALTYIRSVANQFAGVGDDVWEDVRNELLDGVARGQSVEQIAARIRATAQLSAKNANLISRTVVHAAAESGSIAQLRFVGYDSEKVTKEWVATGDARTRRTHRHADGQTVGLDAKFSVGGASLDFPGDPSGPADEVYLCRCTAVFEVDDAPEFRCDGSLVAATTATSCVVPVDQQFDPLKWGNGLIVSIFNAFMSYKISPAWGGAKIHKIIVQLRHDVAQGKFAGIDAIPDTMTDRDILAAVDHYYLAKGNTFSEVYDVWSQTPAGVKALGKSQPTPKGVITDLTTDTPPVKSTKAAQKKSSAEPRPLPPVALEPDPGDLKYVKKGGGSQGSIILEDKNTGDRWLFKAFQTNKKWPAYSSKFLGSLDTALARIQSKAYQTRPAIYAYKFDDKAGSIQYMFPGAKEAFPNGAFDPFKLSPEDIYEMQREQIYDWLVSNWDTHSAQWLRLADGRLYGIDKGQAFKFFPDDKLDWDYVPVYPLNPDVLTFKPMWSAFVQGKDIELQDPTTGDLGAWIDRLMAIPDDEYRALLMPFATEREKLGYGPATKFLADAVKRKNNLRNDWAEYWARATKERAKHVGTPTPVAAPAKATPTPTAPSPTPTAVAMGDGTAGDITGIMLNTKFYVTDKWKAAGAGKKVTPAWGGAKIHALVQELRQDTMIKANGLTELQIVRILDEQHGFAGKPKSYETVYREWLETPNGKKALTSDDSMKSKPITATPGPKPIVSPIDAVDDAAKVIAENNKTSSGNIFDSLPDFSVGDAVAYGKTVNGDTLRVVKLSDSSVSVYVRKDSLGKTSWDYDATFEYAHQLPGWYDMPSPWLKVTPKKVKPGGVSASHVPGKKPGDDVTVDEIWQSKFLWKENEVIAKATYVSPKGAVYQTRLISDGQGGMTMQVKAGDTDWTDIGKLQGDAPPKAMSGYNWELSADALVKDDGPSVISGFQAGDVVGADVIYSSPNLFVSAVAYAQDGLGALYRMRFGDTGWVMETRSPGQTKWYLSTYVNTPEHLKTTSQTLGLVWRAAKADGTMSSKTVTDVWGAPDAPKTAKVTSKYPNLSPGDEVSESLAKDLFMTYENKFDDYEIIMRAVVNEGTLGEAELRFYRITGSDGNPYFVREFKMPGDTWTYDGLHKVSTFKPSYASTIKWVVPGDGPGYITAHPQASSTKVAKKAVSTVSKSATAKKAAAAAKGAPPPPPTPVKVPLTGNATHIPGKSVGDDVEIKDIFKNSASYADGEIIAEGTQQVYGTVDHWRAVLIDGHLVVQKQTKAGGWGATKLITKKTDWPQNTKWKAANGVVTPAQKKVASKVVAKKTAPKTTPSPSTYSPPSAPEKLDVPSGVTLEPGQKVQTLGGSSPWDETVSASRFHALTGAQMKQMQDVMLAGQPWTAKQRAALRAYTGGVYRAWNKWLRGTMADPGVSSRSQILHMQAGMRPTTRDVLVKRGQKWTMIEDPSQQNFEGLQALIGHRLEDAGFMSTSSGAEGAAFSSQPILLEIEVPKGTPAAYVDAISQHKGERELILAAGLRYRVISVKKAPHSGQIIVRMRVVA